MPTTWTNPKSVTVEVNDPTIEIAKAKLRQFKNPIRVTASQSYAVVEMLEGEDEEKEKKLYVFPYTSVMSFVVVEDAKE